MRKRALRYSRGLKLFDEGNTICGTRRVRARLRARTELPNPLQQSGFAYKKTNDYVEALRAFERYLLDGGDEVPERPASR